MSDDDLQGWALPAFKPDEALLRLKRELRGLGLTERAGQFERGGQAIAKAELAGAQILAARVKRPMRSSPQWETRSLRHSADVRDFVQDLKHRLADWGNSDE